MKIGVAGGIGSGKSTVVETLKFLLPNYKFFSIDEAVKNMYEKDSTWRATLINELGTCDKATVSSMAFRNENVRQFLMQQSEYHLSCVMKRWLREENVVIEIPLMFELNLEKKFETSILITANVETRVSRVMKRDARTEEEIRNILEKQLPDSEKIPRATLVIQTDSQTPAECAQQIKNYIEGMTCHA